MAFRDIAEAIPYPDGTSARFRRLDARDRLLDGTFYDHLSHPFSREFDGSNHVRLEKRRPSVVYNLARVIVDQTSALTFGESHAPHIRCSDEDGDENPYKDTESALDAFVASAGLHALMAEAVFRGSVGSCFVRVRALDDGRPSFSVIRGKYARPIFDLNDPGKLRAVVQMYPASGEDLAQYGYERIDEEKTYWMRIELGPKEERWYLPLPDEQYQRLGNKNAAKASWSLDRDRSYSHGFGVVPGAWVANLARDGVDGDATFGQILDICVELDYTLSQIGRGMKYAMDPLLVVQRGELASSLPVGGGINSEGNFVKDPSNALVLPPGAAAQLLEMTGSGFAASKEYVRLLREYALEVVGGMKSDSETTKGAQSGRAMELLHQALLWLVGRLRSCYGDGAFVSLLKILLLGVQRGILSIPGRDELTIDPEAPIRLVWPSWWTPRGADLLAEAQALSSLTGGVALLPRDTGTRAAAMALGVSDPNRVVGEMTEQQDDEPDDAPDDKPDDQPDDVPGDKSVAQ